MFWIWHQHKNLKFCKYWSQNFDQKTPNNNTNHTIFSSSSSAVRLSLLSAFSGFLLILMTVPLPAARITVLPLGADLGLSDGGGSDFTFTSFVISENKRAVRAMFLRYRIILLELALICNKSVLSKTCSEAIGGYYYCSYCYLNWVHLSNLVMWIFCTRTTLSGCTKVFV